MRMDWAQFFTSIVESLAWPGAIVLVLLFSAPVRHLLFTLSGVKYKGLELYFSSELRELTHTMKTVKRPPGSPPRVPSRKRKLELRSHDLAEAERLVADFPEPALAVGWRAIEDILHEAVRALDLGTKEEPRLPLSRCIELLLEQGDLDVVTVAVITRMRHLRNIAVHGGPAATPISSDDARAFIALANEVSDRLGGNIMLRKAQAILDRREFADFSIRPEITELLHLHSFSGDDQSLKESRLTYLNQVLTILDGDVGMLEANEIWLAGIDQHNRSLSFTNTDPDSRSLHLQDIEAMFTLLQNRAKEIVEDPNVEDKLQKWLEITQHNMTLRRRK